MTRLLRLRKLVLVFVGIALQVWLRNVVTRLVGVLRRVRFDGECRVTYIICLLAIAVG